jgi:uncharacterized phiE125 gp8 family phage protein
MNYKIITPVSTEPVTLLDALTHIRVSPDELDEQSLVSSLITAAREYCEGVTRRALATQTIEAYPARFPPGCEIELPRPPLQSVTSVKYTDSAGTETTLTADTDYIVDTDGPIGRIVLPYGKSWPAVTLYTVNPIKIRYVAGYTTIPAMYRQAILLLVGHWYENREVVGQVTGKMEIAVDALLSMDKAGWF